MDNEWHKFLNEEACNGYGHLICLNDIEGGTVFGNDREEEE